MVQALGDQTDSSATLAAYAGRTVVLRTSEAAVAVRAEAVSPE